MPAERHFSEFQIAAMADHDSFLQLLEEDENLINFFIQISNLFTELNCLPDDSTMKIAYKETFSVFALSLKRNMKGLKIAKKLLTQIDLLYP